MTLPSDPLEALKWAMDHSGAGWWMIGIIGAAIAWTSKGMRAWKRANSVLAGGQPAKPGAGQWTPGTVPVTPPAQAQPAAPSAYAAAPSYAAKGYTAQPAYAAPPAAPPDATPARKLHRETAPAKRGVTPVARSVDVPAATASGRWTLAGAFGDPAHARTAIVVAEILGPPPGLR